MKSLIDLLHTPPHTLVVEQPGAAPTAYDGHGVADLFGLLSSPDEPLRRARVADHCVGLGAAVLMVLGGVAEVYADILSAPAAALLTAYDIPHATALSVPQILNRARTGRCPLEDRLLPLLPPEPVDYAALPLTRFRDEIAAFRREMMARQNAAV